METQTTIIEVNGVKLEVDLRSARRIDELKIGSRVKCLTKDYSGSKVCPGVVVGFEPFKSLPTIVVAYLSMAYGAAGLTFKSFNADTKDFEIVMDIDNNALELDRDEAIEFFTREIGKKEAELAEAKAKRKFFEDHFGRYFGDLDPRPAAMPVVAAEATGDDIPF